MRKNRFYLKLLAACLLIAWAYTFIAGSVFLYKNNEIVQLELDVSQKAFLEQARDRIDTKLSVAQNLIRQFRQDPNIYRFAKEESLDYATVTRIFEYLSSNSSAFSEYGYNIGMMTEGHDLVITPFHTTDKKRYYKELNLTAADVDKLERWMVEGDQYSQFIVLSRDGEKDRSKEVFLTLVRKEKLGNKGEIIVFVSLNESHVFPVFNAPGNQAFGILDSEGVVTLKSGLPYSDHLLTDQRFTSHKLTSREMSEWQYVYIVPANGLGKRLQNLALDSMLVYVLLGLFGAVVAWVFATRLYRPIRSVIGMFRGEAAGDDSGDEFTYLHKMIRNDRGPLKTSFLRNLLFGLVAEQEMESNLRKFQLEQRSQRVSATILAFANDDGVEERYAKEAILDMKFRISSIIKEQLSRPIEFEWLELEWNRMVLVMEEDDSTDRKKLIYSILEAIESLLGCRMVAAIGKVVPSYRELDQSFHEALDLLQYKFYADRQAILTAEELKPSIRESFYYPTDVEQQLIQFTLGGKESEARAVLSRVLHENLGSRSLSREALSPFIFAMVTTLNRILHQLGNRADDLYDKQKEIQYYTMLNGCSNKTEFIDTIHMLYEQIWMKINQQHEYMDRKLAQEMMSFIGDHFDRDLSLRDLAEQFNLSAGYISTLFKAYTGSNFKDYLNMQRVEKAKELLAGGKMKVHEVAAIVGCNNVTTFIRMFKKYEGVSPGQYSLIP